MDETNTLLVPPRETYIYNYDSPGFSDTSSNYTGSERDFWYSDNSSATSGFASPLGPPPKPPNQDILPSPPSPLRDISFEDRQREIKTQVFRSNSSSDSSQSFKDQSQDGPGGDSVIDPNDPSSQETSASSLWTNLSQEDGQPDQRMDVDGHAYLAMASDIGQAIPSSVRVARALAAVPSGGDAMDVDMNPGDDLAASMSTSDTGLLSRTRQLRRSGRAKERNTMVSSYSDRPASRDISPASARPRNIGRRSLPRNASPGPSRSGNLARVSRKKSESDNPDLPGDHPISATTGFNSHSSRLESLAYKDYSTGLWHCKECPEETFVNLGTVTRHLKETMAHRDPDAFFPCEDCEKKFTRQSALSRHCRKAHGRRR